MKTDGIVIESARLCLKPVRLKPIERWMGFDKHQRVNSVKFQQNTDRVSLHPQRDAAYLDIPMEQI